jgi:hypothetical protein
MKPEYLDQLIKCFREEREAFKAKGAKGDILEESAFLELVLDAVTAKHLAEIRSDPEFWAAILERC